MDREQLSTAVTTPVAAEAQEGALIPSAAPAGQVAPGAEQAAPQVNWDDEANPYRAKATEFETKAQQATREKMEYEANVNRWVAQQAKVAEKQHRDNLQAQFENGEIDARTLNTRLAEAVEAAETRAQQTIETALRPYWARDYADGLAQQHGLSADEREELRTAPPEYMEQKVADLKKRRDFVPATEVASIRQELDQLKRSLAAKQVSDSGVTATLGANPSANGTQPKAGSVQQLRSFLQTKHPDLYERRG